MRKNKILFLSLLFFSLWGIQNACFTQVITKGPYIAESGRNSVTIRWESDINSPALVLFDKTSVLRKKSPAKIIGRQNKFYLYEAKLTGLYQDTKYFYTVKCGKTKSAVTYFKTMPSVTTPFSFIAMGDSRSNRDVFEKIIAQSIKLNPDLVISMGDLVAQGGSFDQWNSHFFKVAQKLINHVLFISTLGDHEGDGDNGNLFRYYFLPRMNTDSLWFSFDFGNAHFVSLDYRHPYEKKMIEWFKKDMEQTDAKWKFVFMHRPCYNLGGHRSTWGRDVWPALFTKYKIDIVFAGHSHQYERFFPVKPDNQPDSWPVTYITTGGAGAGLYEADTSDFLAKVESVHHLININISGDTLSLKTISESGFLIDKLSIIKKNGRYNDEYYSAVRSQEKLNVYTMFLKAISFSIDKIPLEEIPATSKIILKSDKFPDDIKFKIFLWHQSEINYIMEPVEGIIHKNEKLEISVNIFSKGKMTISNWGSIKPDLRLGAVFEISGIKYEITGGRIEYWPEESY